MIGHSVTLDLARYVALAAAILVIVLLLYPHRRLPLRDRRSSAFETARPGLPRNQVAALPVRSAARGALEVLVISTRGSGRWTVPKGWPMPGRSDAEAAAQEAYEEAGVRGTIASEPIGTFEYAKRSSGGETLRVSVYRLDVNEHVRRWRERGQRKQRWLSAPAAADCVAWTGLADIIRSLDSSDATDRGRLDADSLR